MKNEQKGQQDNKYPRRDFMTTAAKTVIAAGALPLAEKILSAGPAFAAASGVKAPIVCLVQTKKKLTPGPGADGVIGEMLDEAIRTVSGESDPLKFWKQNFKPSDRVAVKVSAVIEKQINFGPGITSEIAKRLVKAGLKEKNFTIFERETQSLKKAGYELNNGGAGMQCRGTDEDYTDMEKSGKFSGKFSSILCNANALINVPIMKTHALSGVSIALKNHYGSFDKPSLYHANSCDPFIADLNNCPNIRDKQRIVICDAMRVLYAGGPAFSQNYTVEYNGLLVGTDPVAVDAVGYGLLKKLRKASKESPLPYMPKPIHIKTAAERGLGVDNLDKIIFKQITV